ncbi:MAG TPA: hypothetical protein VGJ39_07105 [Vicinamibacterales bacterium]
MERQLRRRLLTLAFLAAINPSVVNGQAGVRYYRYELLTRAQEFTYANEVSPDVRGRYYAVETDTRGRITRTAVIRDGQKISERVYSFASDGKDPGEYETFSGSEKTGRVRIQRNGDGGRTREEKLTVDGALTEYTLYSYRADSVELTSYTGAGKKTLVNVSFFSPKDILTRSTSYSNPDDPGFHVDSDIDDRTGLRKGSTQFAGGNLSNSVLFNYDDDGDLVRQDVFDPAGNWFAAEERVGGLTTKRLYGSSKELRYSYDDRRRVKETTLFYHDMLVCRFTYDRFADGTVKRTLAFGPDGSLWAEYPDMEILDISQNGRPINGKPAIINKTGDWY